MEVAAVAVQAPPDLLMVSGCWNWFEFIWGSRKMLDGKKSIVDLVAKGFVPSTSALLFSCALIVLVAPQSVWSAGGNKIACVDAGPQAPRDVTQRMGSNAMSFAMAPPAEKMKLCDIHFHRFAEHKASGYLELAGKGDNRGYVCNGHAPKSSGGRATGGKGCGGIENGDTIEVHWVFTTCDVKPGPTLGSCFSPTCQDPQLRVEARVFYLTNDKSAGNFAKFADYSSRGVSLPAAKNAVEYLGSTTGSVYNDGTCSPFKVTWNVSSVCSPLQIGSMNNWCGKDKNAFKEYKAHGVRQLVKGGELLSPIK